MQKKIFDLTGRRIYVPGHKGLLGSAVVHELKKRGHANILTTAREELDLRNPDALSHFLHETKPDVIIGCAAVVGGIQANSRYPVEFINDNILINTNLMRAAHSAGVDKYVYVGSNCMYPSDARQPMAEDLIFTGKPEASNRAYALAKLAGMVQVQSYNQQFSKSWITVIPASMYGPNDNYDPDFSHAAPALLMRFHIAKIKNLPEVKLWGTGEPRREFLYSLDGAAGILTALEYYEGTDPINVGFGSDISIREAAVIIAKIVGYKGEITFDSSKPNGTARKLLDSSRIFRLGFAPHSNFEQGIQTSYGWLRACEHFRGKKQMTEALR